MEFAFISKIELKESHWNKNLNRPISYMTPCLIPI